MSEQANPWEDLVLSILSVNRYTLEKAYSHVEGLRREGLVEPENLACWTAEGIAVRLKSAGFDRGAFMTMLFARRLSSFGCFVQSEGVKECERVLQSGNPSAIQALLLPIHGVGPNVLRNFFVLRGIQSR
jgi:hypothetical protein